MTLLAEKSLSLAKVALAIADAAGLDRVCLALDAGRLSVDSGAAVRRQIAGGNTSLLHYIRDLQEIWRSGFPAISGEGISLVLRATMAAVNQITNERPIPQVVWTGPTVHGSYLRTTREVIREILRSAQTSLLVVGYWIVARDDHDGIIEELIGSLANAVQRTVDVRVVIDERVRLDGKSNRQILVSAWPRTVPLPKILTWKLPSEDSHLKLHAKVIVADQADAIITSANLTSYALDKNMEMGVRIGGQHAQQIHAHFSLLERAGVLASYESAREAP